jgi:membrane protein required for colicin V production
VILISAFVGLRTGVIAALFTAIGIWVGVITAGQISDDLGAKLTSSTSNDTLVTVISYSAIIIASIMIARFAGAMTRKLINLFLLGFIDRLAGLALGVIAGAILAGAIITGGARLTYNFVMPSISIAGLQVNEAIPKQVIDNLPGGITMDVTHAFLETTLMDSSFSSAFIRIVNVIPGNALGFVPSDFAAAIYILEQRIQQHDMSEK